MWMVLFVSLLQKKLGLRWLMVLLLLSQFLPLLRSCPPHILLYFKLLPKGRSSSPPSSKSTSSGSRSSAAFSVTGFENGPSSNMQSMFEQFKSFMVANQNLSSQPSAMTTTQFGLSGSSPSGSGIQEADWDRA